MLFRRSHVELYGTMRGGAVDVLQGWEKFAVAPPEGESSKLLGQGASQCGYDGGLTVCGNIPVSDQNFAKGERMVSSTPWIWPLEFPEDCPPEQAPPAFGTCYRIVKNNPPEWSDFISVYHKNPTRAEKEISYGRRSRCETMGLSVFTNKSHAVECAQQYPKIGDKIATLTLTLASGEIIQTGSAFDSHNTWWKAENYDLMRSVQDTDNLQLS